MCSTLCNGRNHRHTPTRVVDAVQKETETGVRKYPGGENKGREPAQERREDKADHPERNKIRRETNVRDLVNVHILIIPYYPVEFTELEGEPH